MSEANNQDTISTVTKSVGSYLATIKTFAIQSGMDTKSLKALDKSILAKGGVLGIVQIAIATNFLLKIEEYKTPTISDNNLNFLIFNPLN